METYTIILQYFHQKYYFHPVEMTRSLTQNYFLAKTLNIHYNLLHKNTNRKNFRRNTL
jgi:hypothetical protein